MTNAQYEAKQLEQLYKATCIGAGTHTSYGVEYPVLLFKLPDGSKRSVMIMADPEGNDGGAVNILKV